MPDPRNPGKALSPDPIRVITDVGHHSCPLAFAVDPYPAACEFRCLYCYASGAPVAPTPADYHGRLDTLLREAAAGAGTTVWHRVLQSRTPLRIGYLRDPLPSEEATRNTTRQLLELLNSHGYPFVLFTKSALVGREGYPELLAGKNASVQISLMTLDDEVSAFLEPQAPPPRARLEALGQLCRSGVRTVARVNPLLRRVAVRRSPRPCFSLGLLDEIRERGAAGVIFGSLNRRGLARDVVSSLVPEEEPDEHRAFIEEIAAHCKKIGLVSTLCLLSPRPEGFPVERGAPAGSCCQVDEAQLPFGVSAWTRLACSDHGPLERAGLWLAHVMMSKLHE